LEEVPCSSMNKFMLLQGNPVGQNFEW
jgi:hypothetical protein